MVLHCFQRPKVGQILRLVCAVVLVPTEKPVSAFTVFHYFCFILRLSLPMIKVPFLPKPGSYEILRAYFLVVLSGDWLLQLCLALCSR